MSGTSKREVVISGIGIISPLGIGTDKTWEGLSAGRSGIAKIELLADSELPDHIGGQVKEFTPEMVRKLLNKQKKSIKAMCREIQMGVASANMALDDAGLGEGQTAVAPERLGIDFGANLMLSPPEILARGALASCAEGSLVFQHDKWGKAGLGGMEPLWLLLFLPNMPACHIGIYADARGPSNSLTMGEASGGLVMGEAIRILERDSADVMICGTTGTTLHAVQSMHAVMWHRLAPARQGDPGKACRPFDLNRAGQVVSEAAATLILENGEHARQRGAKIMGNILGAGSACVAKAQGVGNTREALKLAMQSALRDAGLKPEDMGHVNAHAAGDPQQDEQEALAIHDVFGSLGSKIPVTAFKSYWGNPGASCGTLEIVGSLLGLNHGVVLPTLNYETPDPRCNLNVVHGAPLQMSNKTFIKASVTDAGQASAIVMSAT